MALGSLTLRVSKIDFERRIAIVDTKINMLMDVITRYGNAKNNLDQFIEGADSNYEAMVARIDANMKTAKQAHAALVETRNSLQDTVDKMAGMGDQIKETIVSATDATVSTVQAVLKISEIL
jgi:methyl-accepting chemotaxis protein